MTNTTNQVTFIYYLLEHQWRQQVVFEAQMTFLRYLMKCLKTQWNLQLVTQSNLL